MEILKHNLETKHSFDFKYSKMLVDIHKQYRKIDESIINLFFFSNLSLLVKLVLIVEISPI